MVISSAVTTAHRSYVTAPSVARSSGELFAYFYHDHPSRVQRAPISPSWSVEPIEGALPAVVMLSISSELRKKTQAVRKGAGPEEILKIAGQPLRRRHIIFYYLYHFLIIFDRLVHSSFLCKFVTTLRSLLTRVW